MKLLLALLVMLPLQLSAAASPLLGMLLCNQAPDTNTGGACVPDYGNPGGTGDRTALITVTQDASESLLRDYTGMGVLVNGDTTSEVQTYFHGSSLNGTLWIRFDFGSPKLINEARYYQANASAQGNWQWQGSANATDWTDLGNSFALGGTATQTLTSLSDNSASYRYYRLQGVSGSTSSSPWVFEFEFKLCAP